MSSALESYVNRPVSVITADGRNFIGTLKVPLYFIQGKSIWYLFRVLTRPSTSYWTKLTRGFSVQAKGWSRLGNMSCKDSYQQRSRFQVVLGLHIVRGDNICVVGEIDEDIDQRLDLHNIKAEPLNAVPHGAH